MSTETISISKPESPEASMNFDALYKEGIGHLENLSGKLWTDYNAHDPGITIFEVLCYAITELGYRCEFEVGDIITPKAAPGTPSDFFTLAQVASNAPLTISDYRKLLIDLPGIRNAWLERSLPDQITGESNSSSETYLYYDPDSEKLLTYEISGGQRVSISGLYNVYVQFEEDTDYGDLNDNSMGAIVALGIVGHDDPVEFEVEIEFPIWQNLSSELDAVYDALMAENAFVVALDTTQGITETDEAFVYSFTLIINPTGRAIELSMTLRVVSGQEQVLNRDNFLTELTEALLYHEYDPLESLEDQEWVIEIFAVFLKRRKLIQGYLDDVRKALAEHRNLCEDFLGIYPMSLQEIGLEVEFEVEAGHDHAKIMAEAFFKMETYLSAPIQFYSLREMLAKGYTTDEIFNGPILNNGFIDHLEEAFTQRREIVFTSDLVKEFMGIDGVKAVKKIALSRYLEGILVDSNFMECMRLQSPERLLPRLNYTRSKVLIDDGKGKSEEPDRDEALELLGEYKALDQLKGTAGQTDLAEPEGSFRDLETYFSIQNEFPITYGIGYEGLAPSEPDARKAQAKQLKAYLLFFEQLLADFMSQLGNLRNLFAFQAEIDKTYFTQGLYEIPQVKELIKDFTTNGGGDWETYIASAGPTHYATQVQGYAESEAVFQDRRKRFLDHLLARFNESFSEYAAYVFSQKWESAEQYSTLIGDQVRFLRNYVEHSHDRGISFNYQALFDGMDGSEFWNSTRVTGLKKRMVYLTGLPRVEREFVSPYSNFEIYKDVSENYRWRLLDTNDTIMMYSQVARATLPEVITDLGYVISQGLDETNYVNVSATLRLVVEINAVDTSIATVSGGFIGAGTEAEAVAKIIARIESLLEIENFHVVEHILLRPRVSGDQTMALRVMNNCPGLSIIDPYSFRISVVLPAWANRFSEMEFRRMFKKMMRLEAPAHVYIHFYWVDEVQMYYFEQCWADWLNGEWIAGDTHIIQESSDRNIEKFDHVNQENTYYLLVEQNANTGADGIYFVDCLSKLKNLHDAYYTLEAPRIVDQYADCDVLATVVDPDGDIVSAKLANDSPPLPPGVCLNACDGTIRVEDRDLLSTTISEFPLEIVTLSSSGEVTHHSITIVFIPNGPATAFVYPALHIAQYENGDPLVSFTDVDGDIIQAQISSGSLPQGTTMDALTGLITVADKNNLQPGNTTFSVKLMDEEGGTTHLTITIVIIPDTEATFTTNMPADRNEDAYAASMTLVTISDNVDAGIVTCVPRLGEPSLALLGLDFVLAGTPPAAALVINNLTAFQAALISTFSLSGNFYSLNYKVRSTDAKGGTTDLTLPLKIRRDTVPVVTAGATPNQDAVANGLILSTITDTTDNGIHSVPSYTLPGSVPGGTTLNDLGMTFVVSAGVATLRVQDLTLFLPALTAYFSVSGGIYTFSFTAATVDNTGGKATVPVRVQIKADVEPTYTVTSPRNIDTYTLNEVLVEIRDLDGSGIILTESDPAAAFPFTVLGLVHELRPDGATGRSMSVLKIGNLNTFKSPSVLSTYYTVENAATNTYKAELKVKTTDATGGKGQLTINLLVIRDIEAGKLPVNNGLPVDAYTNGMVIFEFKDEDPTASLVSIAFSPPLTTVPGLIANKVGDTYRIVVSNSSLLVAGTYPFHVTLTDSQGGITEHDIEIIFLMRFVSLLFTVPSSMQSTPLDIDSQEPGLRITSLESVPSPTLGTLVVFLEGSVYFSAGSNWTTSNSNATFTFYGEISSTGELVEGSLVVQKRANITVGGGKIGDRFEVMVEFGGGLKSAGSGLERSTNKILTDIQNAKSFEDNPQLRINPAVVGAYVTGKKDSTVATELKRLTEQTSNEILRLKNVVASTTGTSQTSAREELTAAVELYRKQVLGAVEFAGEVRVADLDNSDPVKELFTAITTQIQKIQ